MSLVPQPSEDPATGNESLSQTLTVGNITGANDISVSNPQKISFGGNIVLKNHTGTGGTDVVIDTIPPAPAGPPLTRQVFVETATNKLKHQTALQENLSQTLGFGNTTGANNIIISNGQKISYAGNIRMFQAGVPASCVIDSIPPNTGPTLPEIGFDITTNRLLYQSIPPNSYPTQIADYTPDGNPGEAANIQYMNNANLGMCSAGSYGTNYSASSINWYMFPVQVGMTLPPLVFQGLGTKPYLCSSKSGSFVFTGAPIKNRIWYRLKTAVVFNGQITQPFGICFTYTNTTTNQTLENTNWYSIGFVPPNGAILPNMAFAQPVYDNPSSPTQTYYFFDVKDCVNVGNNGFINVGDGLRANVYGGFLNGPTTGSYVGGPNILEGWEQGFLPQ